MADVAVVAGVSHMTVSRVLNDPGSVKPATRDRVQAAMRSLGYRPNTVARALATGRTRRIGVLAPATALYGPTSMLLSIETAARVAGYHLDIVRLRSVTRRSVTEAAQGLQSRGIDGIIGITPHTWAPRRCRTRSRTFRWSPSKAPRAPCPPSPWTRSEGRSSPPSTCSASGTPPSGTWRGHATGSRRRRAWEGGARRCSGPAARCRQPCREVGVSARGTTRDAGSPRNRA